MRRRGTASPARAPGAAPPNARFKAADPEQDAISAEDSLFGLLLGVHLLARVVGALLMPIMDCDETFNFLEPTHFLAHGFGFQTWEYRCIPAAAALPRPPHAAGAARSSRFAPTHTCCPTLALPTCWASSCPPSASLSSPSAPRSRSRAHSASGFSAAPSRAPSVREWAATPSSSCSSRLAWHTPRQVRASPPTRPPPPQLHTGPPQPSCPARSRCTHSWRPSPSTCAAVSCLACVPIDPPDCLLLPPVRTPLTPRRRPARSS